MLYTFHVAQARENAILQVSENGLENVSNVGLFKGKLSFMN